MSKNPAQRLVEFGQSVWYDNISREIINNGALKKYILEWGVRGLTSNPTIFDNAISKSNVYDGKIAEMKKANQSVDQIYEAIAIADIADAADLLLPIYKESNGDDGFVSIEVSPLLASDTAGTVEEAKRLYKTLNRPNIMVKVPGTKEGLPAVAALLEEGISVNITLLFSVENYVDVAKTYCQGLSKRAAKGLPIDKIRSVASFFVSRVDTIVDGALEEIIKSEPAKAEKAKALLGAFGIANSKLAYAEYLKIFEGPSFSDLKAKGGVSQRPLWASTGTKNPKYRDVLYVEELIGPNTVNTMPHQTLEAFVDHGVPKDSLTKGHEEAQRVRDDLLELGINLSKLMQHLQDDGVKKFSESFHSLNKAISSK